MTSGRCRNIWERVLMYAVMGGNFKIVKLLLEKGAEVNVRDETDWTALKIATAYEESWMSKGIVRLLKAHGAKERGLQSVYQP